MHPIQEPRNSGLLRVSDIHEIYWEESGNPDGHPVIFLHGGPGAGASPACRGFFNPEHFRIVIIDQRGCGRSKPYACVEDNTTWDLVADIEKVREMLGIQKWLVFGGSWGSTLSLTYAETHPDRVSGLVLRGIFLCRPSEMAWLNEAGGVSQIYPAQWQKFIAPVAENKRQALIKPIMKCCSAKMKPHASKRPNHGQTGKATLFSLNLKTWMKTRKPPLPLQEWKPLLRERRLVAGR